MKLNIEELAREAKDLADRDFAGATSSQMANGWTLRRDSYFARLIVERCAAIVQANADECSKDSIGRLVLGSNAAAIRNLLED